LSDIWRADARSRKITRPEGIAKFFQVKRYSIEPFRSITARSLLSIDRVRTALRNEAVPDRPEVPFVHRALSFAGARKGLTWTASGPKRDVWTDASDSQGERPSSNPGEEMALSVSGEVRAPDIRYAPFVHVAIGDDASLDELA